MGKKHKKAKKPGAIGSDGLSEYVRKCRIREETSELPDPPPESLPVAKATPVSPNPSPAVVTEKVEAVFLGISEFPLSLTGEELFLPWRVLKQSGLWLRKRQHILCEVTAPEPGHRRRQIASFKLIE